MALLDHIALAQARWVKKPVLSLVRSPVVLRALFTATVRSQSFVPFGVSVRRGDLGGVRALRLGPVTEPGGAVLCLHGGGFSLGSAASHAPLAGQLAKAAGRTVWVPDYRRAPEHVFPAALDDCLAAYRALLDRHGADQIALTGDSAGGALCLSLLHHCAQDGLPLPGALVLMSPAADFRAPARAALLAGPADALLSKRWAMAAVDSYLAGHSPDDPRVSPLAAPFAAAPPCLIQYARGEALSPQILAAADALRAAGAEVALTAYDTAYHSFQTDGTPVARRALRAAAAFVNRHLP